MARLKHSTKTATEIMTEMKTEMGFREAAGETDTAKTVCPQAQESDPQTPCSVGAGSSLLVLVLPVTARVNAAC